MKNKILKSALISEKATVKDAMRAIDHSGLRVAYVVDEKKRFAGVVSDSEIRKSILKGQDIKSLVNKILNPNPVILNPKDLSNSQVVRAKIKELLSRMPDSRYILVLDEEGQPERLALCSELMEEQFPKRKKHHADRHVLVVGGAGYLGSILVRKLLADGFRVRVLDLLMFGAGPVEGLIGQKGFELIEGDMRNIPTLVKALEGVDAVINLAAVVGDPACQEKPESAIETNYLANKVLAEACKYHQINRFIYASTCSVYGVMDGDQELKENSPLNPVSLYARSKIQAEEGILSLEDENFSPTILRMSTLYGYSPRMRFDLVVNTMTKTAVTEKKILVFNGGKQWRPLLHVEDAADAYIKCLKAPVDKIKGNVFNVGSSRQNYQIIQIAQKVHSCVPEAQLVVEDSNNDPRNYLVSFSRIEKFLRYKADQDLEKSVLRIKRAIEKNEIKDVNDRKYYNVEYNK
ncbi:MAG: hypothetical protein A2787_08630 [Omnitrophica WOR_2 bacterium RIFCSPHIGHO2_01_FULL_48_9]|nr:MAG: hypothetical protein A3D10_01985 [Omnitrophica WOR_2 bacterium RIFCSPHIGHO2_02_FULL_48_11]OGX34347.1 MAG: hypothetical protein A2787_08630 [Omnitrophica WOR_2 bacterium RIFCSPHIGHO2_01_FULL_48_9]